LAPYLAHTASISNDVLPYLGTFYCGSILALTFYGGVFSALPAYIADLFGQKHAGAIHGKLLTAWAASAVVGPMGLGYMRSYSISNAIEDLLNKIEVSDSSISSGSSAAAATTTKFEQTFGCTIQDTDTTID
jgi:MFS family permease